MVVIGITGTAGSGKGTVAQYLVDRYGFEHFSVRDFLIEEIKRRGMEINRDSMIIVADDLRKNYGSGYLLEQMYKKAEKVNKNCVLESVRAIGEVEALRKKKNFILWGIDAPIDIRYKRIKKRSNSSDMVSFEKFKDQEERETLSGKKYRGSINECVKMADVVFKNTGSIEDLKRTIDKEIISLL
jgi:dephospho-CoA kinase